MLLSLVGRPLISFWFGSINGFGSIAVNNYLWPMMLGMSLEELQQLHLKGYKSIVTCL